MAAIVHAQQQPVLPVVDRLASPRVWWPAECAGRTPRRSNRSNGSFQIWKRRGSRWTPRVAALGVLSQVTLCERTTHHMHSMTAPVLDSRPPLPKRPVPHERTPDRPTPANPRPHAGGSTRHDDTAVRELFDSLYREYAPMVTRVAARALRPSDRGLADDIAQETWLAAWQHLLRGDTFHSPAGFLAMAARRRTVDHYRLARVRREQSTDYTDDIVLARLARLIGAAA